MAIFQRKTKDKAPEVDGPSQKEKVKFSKRPASSLVMTGSEPAADLLDTAFKQQRLKAWQPILTPKAVLPALFIIGLIFAPIGALLVWGSGKVTTITLDYTNCDTTAPTDNSFQSMPGGSYQCGFQFEQRALMLDDLATGSSSASSISSPTWRFSNVSTRAVGQQAMCEIQFNVPYDLGKLMIGCQLTSGPGVFLYYKLTN
jgi:hypothetical protein